MSQQIVILADSERDDVQRSDGMAVLGSRADVLGELSVRNTAPAFEGDDVLHGPGFTIELAPGQDPITQMLLTINDDDIAWVVIMRLARELNWLMLNPMTGRELRPSAT